MSDASLSTAYEATEFWVDDAPCGAFKIRCGELSLTLDGLLAQAGLDKWAYITACNPGSHRLSNEENASRMLELEVRVQSLPCMLYHGKGVPTIGEWPP